jgi:hypothetical protein
MPLQKVLFKPGVNKENTRYTSEGGWYDCDKVRFRQGTPEKIGGWQQISSYTYEGTCRSLWTWDNLGGINFTGVGTNLKFYIAQGGVYNDITPLRSVQVGLNGPFAATAASTTITVTDASHGALDGDYVTFLGAVALSTQTFTGVTLSGVVITGIAGEFSCTASVLAVGQPVTISGVFGGTGSITGYVNPTTYFIIATNGTTTFTLSATSGGSAITTTAGTPTGLTYRVTTNFILTTALAQNTPVILSSTATLPTGLTTNIQYYINVVSGTTVNFTNVPNGVAISTSTAGSGTFSLYVNEGITADVIDQSFAITVVDTNTYTIQSPVAAGVYDTGNGGNPVSAYYGIATGKDSAQPLSGWGAGAWGLGPWGVGTTSTSPIRIWSQANFGQDLIFAYRGGPMYYWNSTIGVTPNLVTITIATPGVFTLGVGGLTDTMAIVLMTSGALPTGLTSGTVYYVSGASGSTFRLSTTYANALAGVYITTSGTQSGTHYVSSYALPVTSLGGASDVPAQVNFVMVSDASRFTLAFGATPYGGAELDPMLIRWSDQESVVEWTPAATNQAGFIRLSHGSEIRTAVQARQEIVVFTDSSVYSLQYLGPPYVWGSQLLGDNISIAGFNTAVIASGVIYWMGIDKFYKYDGRIQTLRCDLRQYIYQDINLAQQSQFFAGTNEGFNEVWWFYCSANSLVIDRYVIYNYAEDIWYYGTLGRTAWLDSGINEYPLAATYVNNLVYHEYGVDDNSTSTAVAIDSYITSAQFDIGDGHNFGFVWRIVPDLTFRGSSTTGPTPQVTMYLLPLQNSGSGYNDPNEAGNQSVGGVSYANVSRIGTYTVDQFTGQVYTRVRGRQAAMKIQGNQLGLQWQLGAPRVDIKPDGRRGS